MGKRREETKKVVAKECLRCEIVVSKFRVRCPKCGGSLGAILGEEGDKDYIERKDGFLPVSSLKKGKK